MSVIVYDGHMLAADMQAVHNGTLLMESKIEKVVSGSKDFFVGFVGSTKHQLEIKEWLTNNLHLTYGQRADYPKIEQGCEITAVVAFADERGMHNLHTYENSKWPDIYQLDKGNKHAFGTGADIAKGAMAMMANAVTAVKAAIQISSTCGFGYEAYIVGTGQYFRHVFETDYNTDVPKEEPTPGPEVGG